MRTEERIFEKVKSSEKVEEIQKMGCSGKKRKERDIVSLCMEALIAIVGAMGGLALAAFVTGSHMVEWNGVWTGIAFVLLTFGIWIMVGMGGRKKQLYA